MEHVMSSAEVEKHNKENPDSPLDKSKTHAIKFLFNDKLNEAADPTPFQIDESLLDKLEKNSIGMPWIVPKYGKDMHIRGTDHGLPDTAEGLLKIQAEYAIGTIKATHRTEGRNVYGIIEVYPEFVAAVEKDLIPPLVSPTLNVIKKEGPKIMDAEFLNLQSVPTSGYPAILTQIKGVCQGGIRKCMEELAPLAAAGKLKASRDNPEKFSNIITRVMGAMSENPDAKAPSGEEQGKALEELQTKISTLEKNVEMGEAKIADAIDKVATAAEGVDENEIKELTSEIKKMDPASPEGEPAPAGAAAKKTTAQTTEIPKELLNHPEFKKLQSDFTELKKLSDKRESEVEAEKRKILATKIVESKLKLKQIKLEDKDAKIEEYVNMKDGENFVDLSRIATELESAASTISGAYGGFIPEMTTESASRSNLKILERGN